MKRQRVGSLNFHDTTLGIWEEPATPAGSGFPQGYEEGFTDHVFTPLRTFLRCRGWNVEPDPRGKHYKPIAKWMWQANHGELRLSLYLSGRHIEISFYQNVVHENPHGGQYDFNRFRKMPYLIRKRFVFELMAVIGYLKRKHGYDGPQLAGAELQPLAERIERTAIYGRHVLPTEDPLGAFNDAWDSDFEKKRCTHRFQRDETGWPTRHELTYGYPGQNKDRNGTYIDPGAERYWIHYSGHIMRGRAYPNMNSMCVFVYGPDRWTQVSSGELFSPQPGESLRQIKGYGVAGALKRLLQTATGEKAIIYRDLLNRIRQSKQAA